MFHTKQNFDCPECGIFLNTDDAVQSHNKEHKIEPLPSQEMCYNWKRGTCIDEWAMLAVLVEKIPEEGLVADRMTPCSAGGCPFLRPG